MRRSSLFIPIFREAKVDANIQGYTVPKGWQVLVWTRGVHMDPEVYTNPKEFDPSRWDVSITNESFTMSWYLQLEDYQNFLNQLGFIANISC